MVSMFTVAIETTIVSTAMPKICDSPAREQ
jgi:hypothetical protein